MSTTVYFHGFADLPHERGSSVKSFKFHCLGHQWFLEIYPRGIKAKDETEAPVEEEVALFLHNAWGGSIKIEYALDSKGFTNSTSTTCFFDGSTSDHGRKKFLKRETALTHLIKGALVIELWMKAVKDPPLFDPGTVRSFLSIKDIYMEKESADVVFEVEGKQPAAGNESESNVSSTRQLYAHRLILKKASPQLADLCMLSDGKSPSVIELPDVSAGAFEALLRSIYGLNIFNVGNDIEHIKEILEAADKYGVIHLKLEVEELLIASISFTTENVIDHFLYAESKNCALLKEAVMDFIVSNGRDIRASKKVKDVPDDLVRSFTEDILTAVTIKTRAENGGIDTMKISELRQKAYEQELSVDGSRETLISLLK